MKKWLVRATLVVAFLVVASAVVTPLVINRAIDTMFGGATPIAQPVLERHAPARFVIANASVLAPSGTQFHVGRSVLIEDGVIRAVAVELGEVAALPVIDGSNLFLVPGYTDSHVHLWNSKNDLLLYLANGVTQVREMHGRPHHLHWREEIESGRLGPDLYVVAAQLATYGFWEGLWVSWTSKRNVVRTPEATDGAIRSLQLRGYDAVKASSFLSRENYLAAGRSSGDLAIPLVGHLPMATDLADLWASNQTEVAHIEELVKAFNREFGGYRSSDASQFLAHVRARRGDVATQLVDQGIAVTSTLALTDSFRPQAIALESALAGIELSYVNPGVAEGQAMGWLPEVNPYRVPERSRNEGWRDRNEIYWTTYADAHRLMIEALLEAGVAVLVGTDANVPLMVPGFSIHAEMKTLQSAGMTPAQVLASATSVPGRWMEWKTGEVREGFRANLLLLRENPLERIEATDSIEMVIVNGRILSRTDLDTMLRAVEEANRAGRTVPIDGFDG